MALLGLAALLESCDIWGWHWDDRTSVVHNSDARASSRGQTRTFDRCWVCHESHAAEIATMYLTCGLPGAMKVAQCAAFSTPQVRLQALPVRCAAKRACLGGVLLPMCSNCCFTTRPIAMAFGPSRLQFLDFAFLTVPWFRVFKPRPQSSVLFTCSLCRACACSRTVLVRHR